MVPYIVRDGGKYTLLLFQGGRRSEVDVWCSSQWSPPYQERYCFCFSVMTFIFYISLNLEVFLISEKYAKISRDILMYSQHPTSPFVSICLTSLWYICHH